MADDDTDDTDNTAANHSMPDPFVLAIGLCQIAVNAKAIEPALKRLHRLGRDIEKAEKKLAALTAQAEQTNAELAARVAALDEREAALDARKTEFESSLTDARDELREHHARLDDTHRQLVHRIVSCSGILADWNPNLQSLPTWDQLKRLVAGLPDDLPLIEREIVSHPRIDALSDTFSDPHADRHGAPFLGSLTRSINHKAASQ
jgi:hypothetical protein